MARRLIIIVAVCLILLCPGSFLRAGQEAVGVDEEKELIQSFASKTEEFTWRGWGFSLGKNVEEIITNLGITIIPNFIVSMQEFAFNFKMTLVKII